MRVLGINAVFHDPAAALVVDGRTVAAAEEERFTRRKHGKDAVPFSVWELPEKAIRFCLERTGMRMSDIDAVGYSYHPDIAMVPADRIVDERWEGLRTLFVRRAPLFLRAAFPDFDVARFHYVAHHVAHAASAYLLAPFGDCAVLVADGRGERWSYLAGRARRGELEVFATQPLPHSLGLLYEDVTMHLGFARSSDEYKVMGLAAHGRPRYRDLFCEAVRAQPDGGYRVSPIDLSAIVPARFGDEPFAEAHADLAASVQACLEETLLQLSRWLRARTGCTKLAMAGGVALNCVANSRIAREGPFESVWVQPASGDSGTALGAALYLAQRLGDRIEPMQTAALGPDWPEQELEHALRLAALPFERPPSVAAAVADTIARNGIVAWFQGRSEFGPRALGHRSLLANPRYPENLHRLNDVKGREQFRPVAPMVLAERAAQIFDGPLPSPYMLFTHSVRPTWRDRIAAVVHVDGTARIQTVERNDEPLVAAMLDEVEQRTGTPVVVNTSLNTAGRPMVDNPRDALELFGSAPVDVLAIGPFIVRRPAVHYSRETHA